MLGRDGAMCRRTPQRGVQTNARSVIALEGSRAITAAVGRFEGMASALSSLAGNAASPLHPTQSLR